MENGDNGGDEGENDKLMQLMIENKVLECEKRKAESEVELWKSKCVQLQLRVTELENALAATKCHNSALGTALANTPVKLSIHVDGEKRGASIEAELEDRSRVRKRLAFPCKGEPNKKMAPSTPIGVRPSVVGVIDIDDSDDDKKKTTQLNSSAPIVLGCNLDHNSTDFRLEGTLQENELPPNSNSRVILGEQSIEDNGVNYEGNMSFVSTARKKRSCNIVTSDAESDDDDNIPLSRLRNTRDKERDMNFYSNRYRLTNTDLSDEGGELANGHRMRRLRKHDQRSVHLKSSFTDVSGTGRKYHLGIPTDETGKNDDSEEEDCSDSDGNGLDGFIVSDSEVLESDASSDGDAAPESDDAPHSTEFSSDSEDALHDKLDYEEIISQIRRNRHHKMEWDFEADMLAAFGKDPELCMRAVCALYRQQTSEEKLVKGTFIHNGRGFSQCDALRGSNLAQFLLDGDPQGDLMKSIQELHEHDPKGLEVCRQLASRYSKQLFEIYKSKEDPFFHPS